MRRAKLTLSLLVVAALLGGCRTASLHQSEPPEHDGRTSESAMQSTSLGEGELASMEPGTGELEVIAIPSPGSPLVAIRIQFDAGSIYDPAGKEGLSALTAAMIGSAGTERRTYSQIVDALYPMAASISVESDREVTVISGEIHRDNLDAYLDLLAEVLLEPGFRTEDLDRNREQQSAYLSSTLRATNDELLGLEMTQQIVFGGHPYGHAPAGTEAGIDAATMDDVRDFFHQYYTQSRATVGIAGGYDEGDLARVLGIVEGLPVGRGERRMALPEPAMPEGRNFHLLEKETASVGIHIAYPLSITRADDDYYPLMVANSFLGEHRTFHGRLMQQLRGKRGLNYGDYSYIEYWHLPPFTTNPSPNVPRRQQYFSVWVRPVVPNTAHFALRNALFEVDRLIEVGLTQEEFEATREFLINYSKLWAQTLADRLGFHMDSRFYGMDYYLDEIEERLNELTVDDVNAAIRRHIQSENFHAVFVTPEAGAVRDALERDAPSPMTYNTEPEPEVAEADRTIEALRVSPDRIEIVPVDTLFVE